MAIAQENKYTNLSGTFPNALMIDASGAGLTDGSEFVALQLNDGWEPFQQAVMSYASGVTTQNAPSGSVGVPNAVADAVAISQMLEALQLAHGIGPGKGVLWFGDLDPSVTGDRVIILAGQGVLISTYPGLDAATYVGDGNNAAVGAAGGGFYRSSDAAGTTPNIAGPYLQLPDAAGRTVRMLDTSGTVDPDGASRFLGDVQLDALQGHDRDIDSLLGSANVWVSAIQGTGVSLNGGTFTNGGAATAASMITKDFLDDGVNGVPRIDSETRMTNISIKMGITY